MIQQRLESDAVYGGMGRFFDRMQESVSKARATEALCAASSLHQAGVWIYGDALKGMLESRQGRGRPPLWMAWAKEAGPYETAAVVSKVILDRLYDGTPLTSMAMKVAGAVLDEVRFQRLREAEPGKHKWAVERAKGIRYMTGEGALRKLAKDYADLSDIEALTGSNRNLIGTQLLDLYLDAVRLPDGSPLMEVGLERKSNDRARKKSQYVVRATEAAISWIEQRDHALATRWPQFGPMVEPPLPWGKGQAGGYRYRLAGVVPMVKTRSKDAREMIANADLPMVYNVLNRHQDTAWKINLPVFLVMRQVVEVLGGGMAGVPSFKAIDPYDRPYPEGEDEAVVKAWKRRVAARFDLEEARSQNARRFAHAIYAPARKLLGLASKGADRFWYVWNCDFRGRIYPVCDTLHPQGDDLSRGLLEYADSLPIGDAREELAVTGANALESTPEGVKLTKLTYAERAAYIERHTDRIVATADNPLGDLWWTQADKPWQFLAFIFEWAAYAATGFSPEFETSLPCPRDGSCNGIQHLATLGRDEACARRVNVLPTDQPQDIYSDIAEATVRKLSILAAGGDVLARKWIEAVNTLIDRRKLVKRPAMTISYGATEYGFVDQLKEFMRDLDEVAKVRELFTGDLGSLREGEPWTGNEAHPARVLLAKLLWEVLCEVVDRGMALMGWMQAWATIVAKGGLAVAWEVPVTGLPVMQEYWIPKEGKRRVETTIGGKVVRLVRYEATRPSPDKNRNAVAPNVIHSLDAAHLAMTVSRFDGVVSTTHDSYATSAPLVKSLAKATRASFVELYEHPILDSLERDFRLAAGSFDGDAPVRPTEGALDLSSIHQSAYLFS